MSVAAHLGVGDPDRGLLGEARRCWPAWAGEHPSLGVVADLVDLQGWTYSVGRARADEVLHTLAMLASPSGGDDTAAAGALAWLLLPGACGIAWRLQQLSERIDETVAAELWVEVRSFPWQRLRKVAANILLNTRRVSSSIWVSLPGTVCGHRRCWWSRARSRTWSRRWTLPQGMCRRWWSWPR